MEQRMRTGGAKQRKDVFREFLQDVIRKANPGQQPQGPKKSTIAELPEKVIIRKSVAAQRAHADDPVPFTFDGDDL
jgi:hypothetical protein